MPIPRKAVPPMAACAAAFGVWVIAGPVVLDAEEALVVGVVETDTAALLVVLLEVDTAEVVVLLEVAALEVVVERVDD